MKKIFANHYLIFLVSSRATGSTQLKMSHNNLPLYKQESAKMQKHVKGPPQGISQLFYIAQILQSSKKSRIWFLAIKNLIF